MAALSDHLARHGVSMIQTMYGGRGQPAGIRFAIDTEDGALTFAMPVKVDEGLRLAGPRRRPAARAGSD